MTAYVGHSRCDFFAKCGCPARFPIAYVCPSGEGQVWGKLLAQCLLVVPVGKSSRASGVWMFFEEPTNLSDIVVPD